MQPFRKSFFTVLFALCALLRASAQVQGNNLFNLNAVTAGGFISYAGDNTCHVDTTDTHNGSYYGCSDYMPITAGQTFITNMDLCSFGGSCGYAFYDASQVYVGGNQAAPNTVITAPPNTASVRVTTLTAELATGMVYIGNQLPSSYTPFPGNTAGLSTPTITWTPIPNHTTTDTSFAIFARASDNAPITYSVQSGPASLSGGGLITLTGTPGTVTLLASAAAITGYNAASQTISFTVSGPSTTSPTTSTNLFNLNAVTAGAFVAYAGDNACHLDPTDTYQGSYYGCSDYMPITAGQTFITNMDLCSFGGSCGYAFYDVSKVYLGGNQAAPNTVITAPPNSASFRITTLTAELATGMVYLGTQLPSSYTPFPGNGTTSPTSPTTPTSPTNPTPVSGTVFTAITHSFITDADGNTLARGKECFTPVSAGVAIPATYAHNGVFGTIHKEAFCGSVTAGTLQAGVRLVGSAFTSPPNLCYQMTLQDLTTGKYVIGAGDGYGCIQPSGPTLELSTVAPNLPGSSLVSAGAGASSPGSAATIAVGSTTTGAAGTNASVTNTGTSSAAVLNFVIPRGANGTGGSGGAVSIPTAGSNLVFDGSSITAGQGLTCTGSANHNSHNCDFPGLIGSSAWGAAGAVYDNALSGETSSQILTDYTAGGNTAPPHSLSPAATGNSAKSWYFLDLTEVTNDYNNNIPTATSISNLQQIYAKAHADGYYVVLMTSPITGNGPSPAAAQIAQNLAVAQAARTGVIPSDLLIDLSTVIPDQTDTAIMYQDGTHPTTVGHAALAAHILAALNAGTDASINYTGGYQHNPQTFAGGAIVLDSTAHKWLIQVSTTGALSAVAQ